jgi:amino acid adenylation domain-containing protein
MSLTLAERFRRGLKLCPDRPAVRIGPDTITYQQLHDTASSWAGSLVANGSPRTVGVLAGKTATGYAGLLAVLYAGATVVPLHPSFPAALTRRMIRVAGVDMLIADDRGLAVLPEIADAETPVRVLATSDVADRFPTVPVTPQPDFVAPAPVAPSDRAYILFTSGSTGTPKAVPVLHQGFNHYFDQLDRRCDFGPDDVLAQTYDLTFDPAIHDVFGAWGGGATIQVVPPSAYRDLPAFVADHAVTIWHSTPSGIWLAREMGALDKGALGGLKWSIFGGEALRCQDVEDWLAAAPESKLENRYGPTELSIGVSYHRWAGEESVRRSVNGIVPIGRIHAGHDFRLVTEHGAESAVEGELWITGPQMTTGYLDPADDAGRFVELDGRRWYRTGDRVRADQDGVLAYLGRMDSQVKVHGSRIELAEVDHVLRECDGVTDAVTVARATDHGTELIAFYTGTEVPEPALADGVRAVLPSSAVPSRYVHLDAFPLNANRKVDRLALRELAGELPA